MAGVEEERMCKRNPFSEIAMADWFSLKSRSLQIQTLLSLAVFLMIPIVPISAADNAADMKNFKSTLAGSWYPAESGALITILNSIFEKADPTPLPDNIIGILLPHAGYAYSGETAAFAVKELKKKYKTAVIIGPSHSMRMENTFSVPLYDSYETPLGKVPFDTDLAQKLLKNPLFKNIPEALPSEHSVQMEVPLLQYVQRDIKIVFIIAGQCDFDTCENAAMYLKSIMNDDTLLVVSSDFIHCGQRFGYTPFQENTPENLKTIDMKAFEFIKQFKAQEFMQYVEKSGATICGAVPITVAVSAFPENVKVHMMKYTDSGTVTGDLSGTVSYVSAAWTGSWGNNDPKDNKLSAEDKENLLKMARKSIEFFFGNKKKPSLKELGMKSDQTISQKRACFVTLKKDGHLRGCIGEILPTQELYDSVISNAINSAFSDPRFTPLSKNELDKIDIEISVLTVPVKVESWKDIKIGRDGVILSKHLRKAVFLPQVAPEQGWNLDQMLTNLSMKAGLPPDAYKEGTEFMTFQAEVFGEKEE